MRKLTTKTTDFSPGRKIFVRPNGEFSISEASELPEGFSIGADLPSETGLYKLISSKGSYVILIKEDEAPVVLPWRTSTGSQFDYTNRYDREFPQIDFENVNVYALTTPMLHTDYYSGLIETENSFVTYNNIPQAVNKDTLEEVWGKKDWEGITDGYNVPVYSSTSLDGVTSWAYTWSGSTDADYLYEINNEDGSYNYYTINEPFEWMMLKPNGDLLLVDRDGQKAWNFHKTGEGTHSVTPITGADEIYTLTSFVPTMIPEGHFHVSPDKERYYIYSPYSYGLGCMDADTNEFLWDTSSYITDNYPVEGAIQNPVDGNFILVTSDWDDLTLHKVDGVTGQVIQTNTTPDVGGGYYMQAGISYNGEKFYISNEYSNTMLFDYETLTLIDGTLPGVGDFYAPSYRTSDGYEIITGRRSSLNDDYISGIDIINYNENTITNWVASWEKQFPAIPPYTYVTPTDRGLFTKTDAGHIILFTNETLDETTIGSHTPSSNVGEALPEGWYYDTDEGSNWKPAFFFNIRGPASNSFRMNLDFGDGERMYLIHPADGVFTLYTFETGYWVQHSQQSMPLNFQMRNYSRNGSGWLYDGQSSRVYNLLTQETKNIVSTIPTLLGTFYAPANFGGIEYFFTSTSASASAHSFMYNHNSNVWTQIARRPGGTWSSMMPYLYEGSIWMLGHDGVAQNRTTNIAQYNISLNSWTVVATSPEGPIINSSTIYDFPYFQDNNIYLPNSGYRYDIETNTWNDISRPPERNDRHNVVSFRDNRITYIYQTFMPWQSPQQLEAIPHNIAAYALPGAVVPY